MVLKELLSDLDSLLIIDPSNGDLKFLQELKCDYSLVKFDLTINPFAFIFRVLCLCLRFKKLSPDILVSHMTKASVIPLFSAFLVGVKRRVYYNHGVPYIAYSGLLRFLLKSIERWNCFFATEIITVNPELIKPLSLVKSKQAKSISKGSICGLPESFYCSPRDKVDYKLSFDSSTDRGKRFLFVGRPHKRKGFHLILNSFINAFEDQVHRPTLFIVGCSKKDVLLVLGYLPDYVFVLGNVIKIQQIYKIVDFVVLPSSHEGFSYALLEGCASSCPVLAPNIIGIGSVTSPQSTFFFDLNIESLSYSLIKANNIKSHEYSLMSNKSYQISIEFKQEKVLNHYFSYMHAGLDYEKRLNFNQKLPF